VDPSQVLSCLAQAPLYMVEPVHEERLSGDGSKMGLSLMLAVAGAATFAAVKCSRPKRQAVVVFPEVNYELSLVMENVKRESWRRSTSSPKIGILVLIMHTAWSPNTSS
jgi:hypothetical protein